MDIAGGLSAAPHAIGLAFAALAQRRRRMPSRDEVEPPHWTVDKRIPLALIVTIILSTLSVGATAVIAHHRLGSLELRVDRVEASDRQQDRDTAQRDRAYTETLAELRSAVVIIREAVTELRTAMRQVRQ